MSRITSQFDHRSTAQDVAKGRDLSGKTVIVTGGNSGIGLETARAMADAGADVTLAVRDTDAGAEARNELSKSAKGKVTVEQLDLASFASVRDFTNRWGDRPIDILVNNAGVMACPEGRTQDGLETQIGTNHFGHFLLAEGLVPALESGARRNGGDSRLVILSSAAHQISDVDMDDLNFERQPYDKWVSYGRSKTANALFAVEFTRRYADRGITANAVMPGMIHTRLARHLDESELARFDPKPGQEPPKARKDSEQGAATSVWAATAPELAKKGGLYLEDCAQAERVEERTMGHGVMDHALDPGRARKLWDLSETVTGMAG